MLIFFEANFSLKMVATHIAGSQNLPADDLSQDGLPSFLKNGAEQIRLDIT